MKLYTSDGCQYTGMDAATVSRLRADLGRATVFISEAEFNALPRQA